MILPPEENQTLLRKNEWSATTEFHALPLLPPGPVKEGKSCRFIRKNPAATPTSCPWRGYSRMHASAGYLPGENGKRRRHKAPLRFQTLTDKVESKLLL
jgi:hypothetical protein